MDNDMLYEEIEKTYEKIEKLEKELEIKDKIINKMAYDISLCDCLPYYRKKLNFIKKSYEKNIKTK